MHSISTRVCVSNTNISKVTDINVIKFTDNAKKPTIATTITQQWEAQFS